MRLSRREVLGAGLATMLAPNAFAQGGGSQALIPYGAAVKAEELLKDGAYRSAIKTWCQQIVPEGSLKWDTLRPSRDVFDFNEADQIADFARGNEKALRGHTLAWYAALPPWVEEISSAAEAERELTKHIETVVGRYKDIIPSWDVVNEPIPDDAGKRTDIRPSVWAKHLDENYISIALQAAARVDPKAQLVINEYDIEFMGERFARKRDAFRRLITDLRNKQVPLHAIGLQGHLRGELEIDKKGLTSFVAEMKAMGLDVLVTELDVIDQDLPGPPDQRDAIAARKVEDFLEAIFAAAKPTAILTWGITDKYTWVPIHFSRADRLRNRPLPLDDAFQPKPLMRVIERFRRLAA